MANSKRESREFNLKDKVRFQSGPRNVKRKVGFVVDYKFDNLLQQYLYAIKRHEDIYKIPAKNVYKYDDS